jgi:hypothetical protein
MIAVRVSAEAILMGTRWALCILWGSVPPLWESIFVYTTYYTTSTVYAGPSPGNSICPSSSPAPPAVSLHQRAMTLSGGFASSRECWCVIHLREALLGDPERVSRTPPFFVYRTDDAKRHQSSALYTIHRAPTSTRDAATMSSVSNSSCHNAQPANPEVPNIAICCSLPANLAMAESRIPSANSPSRAIKSPSPHNKLGDLTTHIPVSFSTDVSLNEMLALPEYQRNALAIRPVPHFQNHFKLWYSALPRMHTRPCRTRCCRGNKNARSRSASPRSSRSQRTNELHLQRVKASYAGTLLPS